ncbi:HERV-H LTR-associating protein 2 isoform X2 [Hoplias malabaricus]|uniref:HERV-H LTR-associating protein 2 isoform X2 n=1 Tax=Hoplias malabaricus TaxID=27720 RepID=UPI0034624913
MAAVIQVCVCFLLIGVIPVKSGRTPVVRVTCTFHEDCLLPCIFTPDGGEEIRWFRQDVLVYSDPKTRDQPSELFLGRASVSTQQLTQGNASLLLQRCVPRDRGSYSCRIKGKQERETLVIVKVEARIHSVNLDFTRLSGFEEVKCSTLDVYPAPHLSWSTEPPTPLDKLSPITRKIPNKQGLYAVESKVRKQEHHSNFTYICTINSTYFTQTWRTSLTETVISGETFTSRSCSSLAWMEINPAEMKNLTIPCQAPWDKQNFTLAWTFSLHRTSKPMVIYTSNSTAQLMSSQWKGRAEVDVKDGSLRLLNPESKENTGFYTCILSNLQKTHEGHTAVQIIPHQPAHESERKEVKTEKSAPWWVAAVVIASLVVIAALLVGIVKLQDDCTRSNNTERARDSLQVKVTAEASDAVTEGSHLTADPTNEHK